MNDLVVCSRCQNRMIVKEFPNHNCNVETVKNEIIDVLWYGESQLGKNGNKVIWAKTTDGILLELVLHGEQEARDIGQFHNHRNALYHGAKLTTVNYGLVSNYLALAKKDSFLSVQLSDERFWMESTNYESSKESDISPKAN